MDTVLHLDLSETRLDAIYMPVLCAILKTCYSVVYAVLSSACRFPKLQTINVFRPLFRSALSPKLHFMQDSVL